MDSNPAPTRPGHLSLVSWPLGQSALNDKARDKFARRSTSRSTWMGRLRTDQVEAPVNREHDADRRQDQQVALSVQGGEAGEQGDAGDDDDRPHPLWISDAKSSEQPGQNHELKEEYERAAGEEDLFEEQTEKSRSIGGGKRRTYCRFGVSASTGGGQPWYERRRGLPKTIRGGPPILRTLRPGLSPHPPQRCQKLASSTILCRIRPFVIY